MHFTRRQVLFTLAGGTAGTLLAGRLKLAASSGNDGRFRIAPAGEPGEPLLIRGVIYKEDGATPAAHARLFLYHTDRTGIYSQQSGEPIRVARLRAHARADAQGRYEFLSIRPGAYPGRRNPEHIHVHAAPAGTSESAILDYRWAVPSYHFADDPLLAEEHVRQALERGRFSPVVRLTREEGVWRGIRDLRLGERDW